MVLVVKKKYRQTPSSSHSKRENRSVMGNMIEHWWIQTLTEVKDCENLTIINTLTSLLANKPEPKFHHIFLKTWLKSPQEDNKRSYCNHTNS